MTQTDWISPYKGNTPLCSLYLDVVEVTGEQFQLYVDFGTRYGESSQLPMSRRAGDNPDCIALLLCAEGRVLACLYAQTRRDDAGAHVVIQALRVHAAAEKHGLESLFLIEAICLLTDRLPDAVIECDFAPSVLALSLPSAADGIAWRKLVEVGRTEVQREVFESLMQDPVEQRRVHEPKVEIEVGSHWPKRCRQNLLDLPTRRSPMHYRDRHRGRRGVILASGPSLSDVNLDVLKGEIVINVNRSVIAYPDAMYNCTMAEHAFSTFGSCLRETQTLFTTVGRPFGIPMPTLGIRGFSDDIQAGVYTGQTVSLVALQVAVYMGLNPIHFVGLDLCNRGKQTHFFGHDPINLNHDTTEFPKMRAAFDNVIPGLLARGIKVTHSSPVCELTSLPFVPIESIFEGSMLVSSKPD